MDLPCCDYVSVNTNLHRLFELEKHGWVVLCDRSIPEGGLVKTFDITEKGRDLLKGFNRITHEGIACQI